MPRFSFTLNSNKNYDFFDFINLSESDYNNVIDLELIEISWLDDDFLKDVEESGSKISEPKWIYMNYDILNKISKLKNLKYLCIFDWRSKIFPYQIFNFFELERLELLDVKFIDPYTLKKLDNLKNLKFLKLIDCMINEIPNELFTLINLEELLINDEKIIYFPDGIENLKELIELDISSKLKEIPKGIGKLNKLEKFYLQRGEVSNLSEELYDLKNIKDISLSNNNISFISEKISNLKKLNYLTLRNNKISKLPEEISELKNLIYLDLLNNPISDKEKERIKSLLPNCKIDF